MNPPVLNSWVHVLSRFTPEALLFEALALSLLFACYLAFWILKKRRFGSAGEVVPANLVKTYLNELIGDADFLRTQLFGLFKQAGISTGQSEPRMSMSAQSPAPSAADAAKNAEQARVIETLTAEKLVLQKEVTNLKASGASATPLSGESAVLQQQLKELQSKSDMLEGKLAEYSVIEDDLANLKRLQQENNKFRAAIESKGGNIGDILGANSVTASMPVPAQAAAPTASAEAAKGAALAAAALVGNDPLSALDAALPGMGAAEPAAPAPTDDLAAALGGLGAEAAAPSSADPAVGDDIFAGLGEVGGAPAAAAPEAAAPSDDPLASLAADLGGAAPDLNALADLGVAEPTGGADALSAAESAASPDAAPDANFDAAFADLAAPVDASLAPAGASAQAPAGAESGLAAAAPASADADLPPPIEEKSDADLVAEFEKMLNG